MTDAGRTGGASGARQDDGEGDFAVGDVFRDRKDGDICRVTEVYAGRRGPTAYTDNHNGSFGDPTLEELRRLWERVARGMSDPAFRAMTCACCESPARDGDRQTPSGLEGTGPA